MAIKHVSSVLNAEIDVITTKLILTTLAASADKKNDSCCLSQKIIARKSAASLSTVGRHLKKLCDMGLISVEKNFRQDGGRLANSYKLNLDKLASMASVN